MHGTYIEIKMHRFLYKILHYTFMDNSELAAKENRSFPLHLYTIQTSTRLKNFDNTSDLQK
jgi:hypothetical protein